MSNTRVLIVPHFSGEDKGDGGIRRVVEAQRKWLPAHNIDVVDRLEDANVVALHAGNWIDTDLPVVAHCHGLYWEGYEWQNWAKNLNTEVIRTIKQADAVTATSEWVAQAIRRGTWAPVEVMYHGVDPGDWEPAGRLALTPSTPYVLWNKTRVDPICDPAVVNVLAEMAPQARFVTTYGDKTANVVVTGTLGYAQSKEVTRNAGVYLCTARETFGIGTLEAMCAGVPVLGWKWGGQAEFVQNGIHGYLAEPGNYDDLLYGLEYCLANRAPLGRAARDLVLKAYTWQQRIAPYAQLYNRLHAERTGRPKISVVITNYNLGKYLPKAVQSAVDNSKAFGPDEVEIIVVDDASTEPMPTLPASTNLRVIKNLKNLYLAGALNVGIRAAYGKYILPLDADNWLAPEALSNLCQGLDGDPSLDVSYGRVQFVPQDTPQAAFVSDWPPPVASLKDQLAHRNQIPSSSMFRKKMWSRIGGYRRRCHTAEDADFWTRALSTGHTARQTTEETVLHYLDRSDSMSHVQKDWDWHKWYSYSNNSVTRLFAAGGKNIPTHEFPFVSVVIPVGPGHEEYVLDALDSIQNQTLRFWEVILVNNTGNDLTLPKYQIPSWATIKETSKQGAATARNVGIQHSKAPYVVFLDADDWFHPEALERMYTTLEELGANNFVYSDWFVAETGELKTTEEFDPAAVLRQLPFPVTCMYRRSDLDTHNIRFDTQFDGKGWEDWDFAIQCVARAGLCGNRIAAPLFHYRLSSGTLRDKAYVARDDMKVDIYNKWGDYITGKAENMAACGGCGGGRRPVAIGQSLANSQATPGDGIETVQIEYLVAEDGSRTFIGRVTGNRYRFSSDIDHRIRLVYSPDVEGLVSTGLFRLVNGPVSATNFQPLLAVGPPA